jgi:glycosyltransferase involved in cell wall biosynthesis
MERRLVTVADPAPSGQERQSILFLLPTLAGGGSERVALTVIRHLDRSRFDVTLAVVDTRGARYLSDVPPDVRFIDLQCGRVRNSGPAILRIVWQVRPGVIFSGMAHLSLAIALLRPLLPRTVRLIARETAGLDEVLRGAPGERIWRFGCRVLYRRFDTVICQSRRMREDLLKQVGLPPEKASIIRNPVDLERIRFLAAEPLPEWALMARRRDPARIHLLAAGRLSEEKGFDMLVDAIARLADRRVHLTILGEGPLRSVLERRIESLGLAAQIDLPGFDANPYRWMGRAEAFVLSSRHEAFPNVVLESLACGVPVIATPATGGVLELLRGREGCIVAPEVSDRALAQAIRMYVDDRSERSWQWDLEEYDADRVCERYTRVFLGAEHVGEP